MIRTDRLIRTALALSTLAFADLAHAGTQQCHTVRIPTATTNWNTSAALPKFDPADGILTGVDFTIDAKATGSAKFESLDAAPSTVTMNFQSTLTLTRPDNTVIVVAIPLQQFVDGVTAFDNLIDFGGTSGKTYPSVVAMQSANVQSIARADLALFTGPLGNPGLINLPVSAVGSSNASGAGNLLLQFAQNAEATVTVCYSFALDCDHNGIADAADIQGGAHDADQNAIPDRCEPSITRYCFGDGAQNGGAPCPCGNSVPGNLDGCLNSTGAGGSLNAIGNPSVANDTLELIASQLPPLVPGFFFQGTANVASPHGGAHGELFGDGLRCVGGNVVRMAKIQSAPQFGGIVTLPFAGDPPISVQFNVLPGESRFYQVWYRNLGGPCGFPFNTTNGVRVVWGL